jgi:hypothetical protein
VLGSGIRCLFDPGSGMGKNQNPDPGSESEMKIPDHIFENLVTIFWVKILEFFDADLGWKNTGFYENDLYSLSSTM